MEIDQKIKGLKTDRVDGRTTDLDQKVVTYFKAIKIESDELQIIEYPELEKLFSKGYFLESITQSVISNDRFMITFVLKKSSQSMY